MISSAGAKSFADSCLRSIFLRFIAVAKQRRLTASHGKINTRQQMRSRVMRHDIRVVNCQCYNAYIKHPDYCAGQHAFDVP